MDIKRAVVILDNIKPKVYFLDSNNKRLTADIELKPLATLSDIKAMAEREAKKLFENKINRLQGKLNL